MKIAKGTIELSREASRPVLEVLDGDNYKICSSSQIVISQRTKLKDRIENIPSTSINEMVVGKGIMMNLRGGRSKRGGKRVKAALDEAHQRGSNSTAGARYPVGKWATIAKNGTNVTRQTQNFVHTGERTLWTKKKPLSNRQLANQARTRHRHCGLIKLCKNAAIFLICIATGLA